MYIRTNDSNTNAIYINASGNVGIGTTNPIYRVQVGNFTGTSTATPETLNLGGSYSNSAASNIKFRVFDDGTSIGGMSVSNGQMEVNTWTSGKIAFYRGTTQTAIIDANGNLGIATSSPIRKLDVSGSFRVTFLTSSVATVTQLDRDIPTVDALGTSSEEELI